MKAASSGDRLGFWLRSCSVCSNFTDVGLDSILQKSVFDVFIMMKSDAQLFK